MFSELPIKLFAWFERNRYQKAVSDLKKLDKDYIECLKKNEVFPDKSRIRRNNIIRELAEEFPDQESLLLPTPFGNVLRSFETFPRIIYGLDAIPAWVRLLGVMPKDYIELIECAKAQLDFWVNLG